MIGRSRRWRGRAAVATVLTGVLVLGVGAVTSNVTAAPRQDIEQVADQVRDLEMKAGAATERANEAQQRLNDIQADLDTVRNRADRERAELQLVMTTIDDIARATYSGGGMDPTLEVLMADDPAEFLAQAAVMAQLEEAQVADLRRAQTARLRVAQTEAEIADREGLAQQARDEMAAARGEAEAQLTAAEDVLAGLQEAERQRLAQIARERREAQLAEAAAAADAAAAAAASAAASVNDASTQDSGAQDSGTQDSGAQDSGAQDSGSTTEGPSAAGGGYSGGSKAAIAVQYALSQVGDPYSYSANPPSSWDCSKLTAAAWAQAGVGLTALSYTQFDQTRRVPTSEIQPGDLVFYFGSGAHHVGIYVGNGKMVSASNPSDGVEIIDYLGPWYGERFSGVGRVVG